MVMMMMLLLTTGMTHKKLHYAGNSEQFDSPMHLHVNYTTLYQVSRVFVRYELGVVVIKIS